jgi:hypothetical protein
VYEGFVRTYAMRPDCALPTESGNWTTVQTELRTLQATIRDESGLLDAVRRWRSLLVRSPRLLDGCKLSHLLLLDTVATSVVGFPR